jgi:hypothetical protein
LLRVKRDLEEAGRVLSGFLFPELQTKRSTVSIATVSLAGVVLDLLLTLRVPPFFMPAVVVGVPAMAPATCAGWAAQAAVAPELLVPLRLAQGTPIRAAVVVERAVCKLPVRLVAPESWFSGL